VESSPEVGSYSSTGGSDMVEKDVTISEQTSRKLIVPSLFMASFGAQSAGVIVSLMLVDIAATFNCPVGVAGQLRTFQSTMATIFALLMGVLSIRFDHKRLFATGILFIAISYLGSYLAPSLSIMLLFYALTGIGIAIYGPMSSTLAGELLPLDERPKAISWTIAGMTLAYVISTYAIRLIAESYGWRMSFIFYALPLQIISLLLALIGIPTTLKKNETKLNLGNYINSFRIVFSNLSAISCIAGFTLVSASNLFMNLYGITYCRQVFNVSLGTSALILMATALILTFGSLSASRFINAYGRKPLTVASSLVSGLGVIILPQTPNFLFFTVLLMFVGFIGGIGFTAIRSLTLEQIPELRGTIMSFSAAAMQFGYTLGAGIGGAVLAVYSYGALGFTLGGMGVLGGLILFFFAVDPTRR